MTPEGISVSLLLTLQETKIDHSNGHLSGEKDDQPVDLGLHVPSKNDTPKWSVPSLPLTLLGKFSTSGFS